HDYSFSINCPAAQNTRSAAGEPAEMYPISFKTGATGKRKGSPKLTKAVNQKAIETLRTAVDENYSYRDLRKVDWKKLFADAAPKMEKADTPAAFGRAAAKVLAEFKDLHITVKAGDALLATHRRYAPANCNMNTLAKLVPQWTKQHDV